MQKYEYIIAKELINFAGEGLGMIEIIEKLSLEGFRVHTIDFDRGLALMEREVYQSKSSWITHASEVDDNR